MSREVITIGGLSIMGMPNPSEDWRQGLFLRPDGLKGIDGGVAVRREAVDIPGQHGEFDLPVLRGARAITIGGMILARTEFDLGHLRAQVLGVGGDGGPIPVEARHQGEDLSCTARLAGAPEVTDFGYSQYPYLTHFDLQLVAPDPRLYGTVSSSREGEPALNYGNFPAIPEIRATRESGSGGYTVSAGSGQIVVTASLPVGATHRIDLRTGGIYSGSTRLVGALGSLRRWTVRPGVPLVHTASAGIRLDVDTADTYI